MSKKDKAVETTELVPLNASTEMVLNAKVSMDDIISVFASKYEEALHKAADLSRKSIKGYREDIEELQKDALASIDVSKMLVKHPLFTSVKEVSRRLSGSDSIVVEFSMKDENGAGVASMTKTFKLLKKFTDKRDTLGKQLANVESELTQTLQKIRDIGRKERQIRARVVERKLESSGLSDLLQDEEMRSLIAMDS